MKKVKIEKSVLSRLFTYMREGRAYFIGAVISAVLSVVLGLMCPRIVGQAIDCIKEGNVDFSALTQYVILLLVFYLSSAVLQWVLAFCTNQVSYRTVSALRADAFKKIQNSPLSFIDHVPHGDTVVRITTDAEAVGDGLLQGLSQMLTGIVTIIGVLAFMFSMNWLIALLVVLLTPLSILVAGRITGMSHHLFKAQSQKQGELSGFVSEMMGAQKLSVAFSHQEESIAEFDRVNEEWHQAGYKANLYGALVNPVTRFVNNFVYVVVGAVGGYITVTTGKLSIGQVSSFLTYANQYTKPFNEISGVMTQLQTAYAAMGRIVTLLDQKEQDAEDKNARDLTACKGNISFKHVSFGYDPSRTLITDMNLSVKAGEKVAIVGPTGAGKTTLVNLVMRFYELNGGEIDIDGENIMHMTRNGLRSLFGMVLQESQVFSGTVRENIAYGKPEATMEEVIAAAKAAHAHSFIKRLPNGYDTMIGERSGLSQGQMQLLCIARVLLIDPPLLILDEATSAIDTRTEIKIQKAFDAMMQGRTSFIVAHRLSTIREADVILVMRDGNIIEQGRHDDLLKADGFYAKLYNSQFAPSNA